MTERREHFDGTLAGAADEQCRDDARYTEREVQRFFQDGRHTQELADFYAQLLKCVEGDGGIAAACEVVANRSRLLAQEIERISTLVEHEPAADEPAVSLYEGDVFESGEREHTGAIRQTRDRLVNALARTKMLAHMLESETETTDHILEHLRSKRAYYKQLTQNARTLTANQLSEMESDDGTPRPVN